MQENTAPRVEPYLFFDGRCEEAIEFYKKAIGAEVNMLMRFSENPEPPPQDHQAAEGCGGTSNADKIMHSSFSVRGTTIMASDGNAKGQPKFEGFSLTLPAKDESDADKLFAALAKGGQVQMPLAKTFFASRFGMVADKFGVSWMVIVSPPATQSTGKDFVISRVLDASRELVWQAFTDPKRMKEWWGPKGVKVLHSKMDLRPGGTYHYSMQTADGPVIWGKMVYREIKAPERIVFINSFSDEGGGITRHPMAPSWPLQMLTVFTFEELPDGKTRFTVRWSPHEASGAERKTFDEGHGSMQQGWSGTLDGLEAYLAKARRSPAKPKAKRSN